MEAGIAPAPTRPINTGPTPPREAPGCFVDGVRRSGAGFVALAATLPTLGILPVGGLALLLGVERFMSEIRAVTNLFSNIFATVVIARWMGELDDERLNLVLDGEDEDEPLEQVV